MARRQTKPPSRRARSFTAAWFILGAVPAFFIGFMAGALVLQIAVVVAVIPIFLSRLGLFVLGAQYGLGGKPWVDLDDLWTFEFLYWLIVLMFMLLFQGILLARIYAPRSWVAEMYPAGGMEMESVTGFLIVPIFALVVSWKAIRRARRGW